MKLYTEEQVIEMLDKMNVIYSLEDLTPIELPTDEEIDEELEFPNKLMNELTYMFIEGAKWMRDKILKQKK